MAKQRIQFSEVQYEVLRNLGTLSEKSPSWKKEFNLVSWNNAPAKYDIRDWNENRTKMGRGTTLNEEEMRKLAVLIAAELAAIDERRKALGEESDAIDEESKSTGRKSKG